jgi:hypothetical protein
MLLTGPRFSSESAQRLFHHAAVVRLLMSFLARLLPLSAPLRKKITERC